MRFYLDTSVVVAFLTPDLLAPRAIQIVNAQLTLGEGICSDWVCAEYRCAVAAKLRAGKLPSADFWQISQAVDVSRSTTFHPLRTQDSDVVRAGEIAARSPYVPLRAADALHLALAARAGVTAFLTFDKAQAQAVRSLLPGVDVIGE